MDDLLKNRARAAEMEKRRKKHAKVSQEVGYSLNGKPLKRRLTRKRRSAVVTAAVLAAIAAVVYVPPMFYHPGDGNSYTPITADASAIKACQTYLKDSPDDDFDGDGLNNAMEGEYGTDPWEQDSDGDGITDYAELFVTETQPLDASQELASRAYDMDQERGETLGTPYKIDDIIMWPDTYQSKAYGAVVRTMQGYRFCNFTGWVKFPGQVYAYGHKDGVHYELEHKEDEDAWRIESDDEVLLYANPIEFVHCLKLPFMDVMYLEDNGAGRLLSRLLPDEGGIITCHKAAVRDTEPDTSADVTVPIRNPLINTDDVSRFGKNMNSLKDLAWAMKLLESGNCVAVSLYSGNAGEAVGILYGYTATGGLLVADTNLNPAGTIQVTQRGMRMMDKDGEMGQSSWFEWKGLGFDSVRYGDHISFFASTYTDAGNSQQPAADTQGMQEDQEDGAGTADGAALETQQPETPAPETAAETEDTAAATYATAQEPAATGPSAMETQQAETAATEAQQAGTEATEAPATETQQAETPATEPQTEKQDSVFTFGL